MQKRLHRFEDKRRIIHLVIKEIVNTQKLTSISWRVAQTRRIISNYAENMKFLGQQPCQSVQSPPETFKLFRSRKHAYAFSADITKMYRRVLMAQPDRRFRCIFWRSDPSHPRLELNTVTYGTVCAPCQAKALLAKGGFHIYKWYSNPEEFYQLYRTSVGRNDPNER